MSDYGVVASILEHYGTKGMKWGVRKEADRSSGGEGTTVAGTKMDKKWTKATFNQKEYFKAYNHMADQMNSTHIDRINSKSEYKGKLNLDKPGPLERKYYNEYSRTATSVLNSYAKKNLGTSPSGEMKVRFEYQVDKQALPTMLIINKAHKNFAKHDDLSDLGDGVILELDVEWDETGHIKKISLPSITQSDLDNYDGVIIHYGKKGMKWGVRKKPPAVTRYSKNPNRLSDKELQTRIKRLEQEKKYLKLNQPEMTKGKKFTEDLITNSGKQIVSPLLVAGGAAAAAWAGAFLVKNGPKLFKRAASYSGKHAG